MTDQNLLETTSAWSKGLDKAPHDRQILIRCPEWIYPAVIEWKKYILG